MNTLTSPRVGNLIDQLFSDADASNAILEQRQTSTEEMNALRTSTTRYREIYGSMKDFHLAVSREAGRLLYMLARSAKVSTIVEFGTSYAVSTLHLAASLRDNGGGRLITTEFEPSKVIKARTNVASAGLEDLVEIREGDALETLSRDLPAQIDLVLLDGAKSLYPKVLDLLEPHLRPGALIVADNADWCPEYLARVRAAGGPYLSVPFAEDVELSMRL